MSETFYAALVEAGISPDKASALAAALAPSIDAQARLSNAIARNEELARRSARQSLLCVVLQLANIALVIFNAITAYRLQEAIRAAGVIP